MPNHYPGHFSPWWLVFWIVICTFFWRFEPKIKKILRLSHLYYCPVTPLVTQPMLQLRPNWSELRSMDYYHQIFCRFRKCKRKVPPPSPLSNDFEKSWGFSKFLVMIFFQNWHCWTLDGIFEMKMIKKICLGFFRFEIGELQKKLG